MSESSSISVAELLASRYASSSLPPVGPWNAVFNHLLAHRSVRAYRPDPLPEGTLESLVAAAQSASTSSNLQAWSVVAVSDPARKEQLYELAGQQRYIRQAPVFLCWLADLHRLETLAAYREVKPEGLPFLEMLLVGVIDAALAAQNFVVAAESMGLGAVYIGALRNHLDQVAEVLKLPSNIMPVFGMCLGYPDTSRPGSVRPRLEVDAVLHRETYDAAGQLPAVQRYDEIMAAWYERNRIDAPQSWSGHSAQRIATAEALSGRDKLREMLEKIGFGLA